MTIHKMIIVTCACLIASSANAGFWGFREKFAHRRSVPYNEFVNAFRDYCRDKESIPDSKARKNLLQYYEAAFSPKVVKVGFATHREGEEGRVLVSSGVMYFSRGELAVHYSKVDPSHDEIAMNYVTKDGNLYEWSPGAKSGRILKRYHGDTTELFEYLLDPALLRRYMYLEYRKSPESWKLDSLKGGVSLIPSELRFRRGGVGAIGITQEPFWLKSIVFIPTGGSSRKGNLIFTVEPPREVKAIPNNVHQVPADVRFEDSVATVEWRLRYL